MSAITFEGVTKRFGDVVALDGIDLDVAEGEVYGLVGPNGSGKSTALNLLFDFVRPTGGDVTVLGTDPRERSLAVRRQTGMVPEGFGVYEVLTGRQHVEFAARSKGVEADVEPMLDRVGLLDDADRPAGDYSRGMIKRLILAAALVGDPDLLVLDEPFGGLDPRAVVTLRETLIEERERGTTVFFASHLVRHLVVVCDRIGLLLEGELVAEGTVPEVLGLAPDTESSSLESVFLSYTGDRE